MKKCPYRTYVYMKFLKDMKVCDRLTYLRSAPFVIGYMELYILECKQVSLGYCVLFCGVISNATQG